MRIWVDGCFDFTHHGHAGALMQARQLATELYVGVHSDEDILANKGPVVMRLDERIKAVDSCKWVTQSVPDAPYVTEPAFMKKYGCEYVVHGDDITTDADGNDCYQVVKDLGLFKVVKRTPGISTTDLIGRMLNQTTNHHRSAVFDEPELERLRAYATDETALKPYAGVYSLSSGNFSTVIEPLTPTAGKYVYVRGGFDLFHAGHMALLELARARAQELGARVFVGLQSDKEINEDQYKAFPIMNIYERGLLVLQCRYVDAVVLDTPQDSEFTQLLKTFEAQNIEILEVVTGTHDPAKPEGFGVPVSAHTTLYSEINSTVICNRILDNKALYEERQRKKGVKAENEKVLEAAEKG